MPLPLPLPDTWAVVVNWNGAHLLGACLDALARQSHPVTVVVVDNGSTDDSEKVVTRRPGVHWCAVGENLGFARGSNVGIRRALDAGARFVALVNTDVVVEPDWIERLVAGAEAHPEAGIFGGLLLFADDPGRVNSTGLVMDAVGRVRDRDFGVELARLAREDGPTLGVTGGAVLLRADTLRRVGLLDPAYFAYYEDADLCARARRAGIGCRYVAAARARHGFGSTIGAGSPRQRYLLARNHLRFVATHLPLWKAVPVVAALVLLRLGVMAPRELVLGRTALARSHVRGALDGASLSARPLLERLAALWPRASPRD
ncbi:glycosyltransferase family 2 protein [Anaeromyxobacter terrae]|uniref:glycosyltransferase family 2 protein n=1 Tax=Anaeromyxobacter terrae TaxID=2925406 RepID=UPI001F58ADDD|nr:glycosyltransferase family 2 protein [Anaeromyxobacter sp. SG22]